MMISAITEKTIIARKDAKNILKNWPMAILFSKPVKIKIFEAGSCYNI